MDQNPQIGQTNQPSVLKGKKANTPKALLITLAVLAILLACFSGYIFMQYQKSNERVSELESQLTDVKKQLNEVKANKESDTGISDANGSDDSAELFAIEDWGIKFVMPKGLDKDDIIMTAENNQRWDNANIDYIHLTTKKVRTLSGECPQRDHAMGSLIRTKQTIDPNSPSAPLLILGDTSKGYKFYFSGPQSLCSVKDSDAAIEQQQYDLVYALVMSVSEK